MSLALRCRFTVSNLRATLTPARQDQSDYTCCMSAFNALQTEHPSLAGRQRANERTLKYQRPFFIASIKRRFQYEG